MVDWIKWLVRTAASFLLGSLGVIFVITAITTDNSRVGPLLLGSVMLAGAWFSWPKRPNAWRGDPPTPRQIAYAQDLGISIPPGITKGELSDLISQARGD